MPCEAAAAEGANLRSPRIEEQPKPVKTSDTPVPKTSPDETHIHRIYAKSWGADYDELFTARELDGKKWTTLDLCPELEVTFPHLPKFILIREEYKVALDIIHDYHWNDAAGEDLNDKYGAPEFVSIPDCGNAQPASLSTTDDLGTLDPEESQSLNDDMPSVTRLSIDSASGISSPSELNFSLIICGHPGIGKTYLLYVLLSLRCLARRPTWFIDQHGYFYCSENGVEIFLNEQAASSRFRATVTNRNVWCLLNSDDPHRAPSHFIVSKNHGFLIQAASPSHLHTGWFSKSSPLNLVRKVFLQPPTLDEFTAIAEFTTPHLKKDDVVEFYQKFGPSLRVGLEYAGGRLSEWEDVVITTIQSLWWERLFTVLYSERVERESGSHHVVLIVAQPGSRTTSICVLMTEYVQHLVEQHKSSNWEHDINIMYQKFISDPYTRWPASWVLDHGLHRLFSHPGVWTLTKLEKKDSPLGLVNQHWTVPSSSHSLFLTVGDPVTQLSSDQPTSLPSLDLTTYVFSPLDQIDLIGHSGYYRPSSITHATCDAFIYDSGSRTAYALQATVSGSNAMGAAGLRWLNRLPGVDKVIYIVVTSEHTVDLSFTTCDIKTSKGGDDASALVAECYLCHVPSVAKGVSGMYGNTMSQ